MTVLYINGQLCDLPTDFKITLVQENLYFSKASTYTYDIELPITPYSNNAKIFAGINRTDKRIVNQPLPAQLIVDNRVVLNGVAIIVGTSERSVSVQLLQGNSELNWKQRLEATYIDELNLGNISEWGFVRTNEGKIGIADNLKIGEGTGSSYYRWPWNCIYQTTNGDVCTTPIFNSDSGEIMNALTNDEHYTLFLHDNIKYPMGLEPNHTARPNRLAAQPKFKVIFEKIIAALGLTIGTNHLADKSIYQNIYIANSTEVWLIADMLPHLTVVEFFEQVQLFFNVVIELTDSTINIVSRREFYHQANLLSDNTVQLGNIIDEYSTDVAENEEVSESDRSKIYDVTYEDFGTWFLGHDFDNVKVLTASQLSATPNPNAFATNYRGHKVSSPYIDNNQVKGNEIDIFQPSPAPEGTTDEATLKFIPLAKYSEHYAGRWGGLSNLTWRDLKLFAPESVGKIIEDDDVTIQSLLDEGDAPEEKATIDKMSLGFLTTCIETFKIYKDGAQTADYEYQMLTSIEQLAQTIENTDTDNYYYVTQWQIDAQQFDMSLFPLNNRSNTAPIENLWHQFYENTDTISTTVLYTIRFVPDTTFDTMLPVRIKNQNFAVKSIKYSISPRGFEKIAEGDFYKL